MSFQKMFLRSLLLSAALNMVLMSPGFGMETDDSDTAAVKARMHRYVVAAFRASSEVRKRELGEVKADSHPTTRNFAEETEIFESFFAALSAQKEKPRISERVILTETAARLVVTSLAEGGMGAYFLPATLRLILKESVRYIQTPEGRVQAGAALVDGPLSSDKRLGAREYNGLVETLLKSHYLASLGALGTWCCFLDRQGRYKELYESCKEAETHSDPGIAAGSYYGIGKALAYGSFETGLSDKDRLLQAMSYYLKVNRASPCWKGAAQGLAEVGGLLLQTAQYADAIRALEASEVPERFYPLGLAWEANKEASAEKRYLEASKAYEQSGMPGALRSLAQLKRPTTLGPISPSERLRTLSELYGRIHDQTQDPKEWQAFADRLFTEELHKNPENFPAIRRILEQPSFPRKLYYLGKLWAEGVNPEETDRTASIAQAKDYWRRSLAEDNDGMSAVGLALFLAQKEGSPEEAINLLKDRLNSPDPAVSNLARRVMGCIYVDKHLPQLFSTFAEQLEAAATLCEAVTVPSWKQAVLGLLREKESELVQGTPEELQKLKLAATQFRAAISNGFGVQRPLARVEKRIAAIRGPEESTGITPFPHEVSPAPEVDSQPAVASEVPSAEKAPQASQKQVILSLSPLSHPRLYRGDEKEIKRLLGHYDDAGQ